MAALNEDQAGHEITAVDVIKETDVKRLEDCV